MRNVFLLLGVMTLVGLAVSDLAVAAEQVSSQITIDAPTQREDKTPLAASEIAGYRIYQAIDGQPSTDPESSYIAITAATSRTITLTLAPRAAPYVVRYIARTVDTAGRVSTIPSPVVEKTFIVKSSASPSAPVLTVQISCASGCDISVAE